MALDGFYTIGGHFLPQNFFEFSKISYRNINFNEVVFLHQH